MFHILSFNYEVSSFEINERRNGKIENDLGAGKKVGLPEVVSGFVGCFGAAPSFGAPPSRGDLTAVSRSSNYISY